MREDDCARGRLCARPSRSRQIPPAGPRSDHLNLEGSMHRRVQVDIPLHLTITLDRVPRERTAAFCAMLDHIVEASE